MAEQDGPTDAFVARADRILDSAGELMLRHGYRKVTIEDVARGAKIGKGTVYLHWRTKDDLFMALLARESVRMVEDVAARLRADPEEVLPHRLMRMTYLAALRKPLLLAIVTGDTEILGRMAETEINEVGAATNDRFYDVLTDYGLLRDDIPNLPYALRGATGGFYVLDRVDPESALGPEAGADALAHVVRAAFEPARRPRRSVLVGAAGALIEVFEDLIPPYRAWIYYQEPAGSRPRDRKKGSA
ncbi:MAG TPA: TetR/AcrR family transcriptional regulator [Streptosporangiaceae bacterium]|jgi:AcrR family transcriptional regulator